MFFEKKIEKCTKSKNFSLIKFKKLFLNEIGVKDKYEKLFNKFKKNPTKSHKKI